MLQVRTSVPHQEICCILKAVHAEYNGRFRMLYTVLVRSVVNIDHKALTDGKNSKNNLTIEF